MSNQCEEGLQMRPGMRGTLSHESASWEGAMSNTVTALDVLANRLPQSMEQAENSCQHSKCCSLFGGCYHIPSPWSLHSSESLLQQRLPSGTRALKKLNGLHIPSAIFVPMLFLCGRRTIPKFMVCIQALGILESPWEQRGCVEQRGTAASPRDVALPSGRAGPSGDPAGCPAAFSFHSVLRATNVLKVKSPKPSNPKWCRLSRC